MPRILDDLRREIIAVRGNSIVPVCHTCISAVHVLHGVWTLVPTASFVPWALSPTLHPHGVRGAGAEISVRAIRFVGLVGTPRLALPWRANSKASLLFGSTISGCPPRA